MSTNPITATVDFNADGVHYGYLKLPHSADDSAWGAIMIPIAVVKNGDGPTALLTGANHGDEYEGPLALWNLARELKADELSGRVIIVPAMNYPAFRAARRSSPIDGGNMNRVFPGSPTGSVTEKIADYFQRVLLPLSDYVLDMHSGGKTLDFVPFACAHVLEDKALQARCVAAVKAFNAPYSLMLLEPDATQMYDTAAEQAGKVFVSTELGGGGSASAYTTAIAKRGTRNFLRHAGIVTGALHHEPSTWLDTTNPRGFLVSEHSGLLELCANLGDRVQAGELLCRVHDIERIGTEPNDYHAAIDGVLLGRHFPCLTRPGDNLAVVGKVQR